MPTSVHRLQQGGILSPARTIVSDSRLSVSQQSGMLANMLEEPADHTVPFAPVGGGCSVHRNCSTVQFALMLVVNMEQHIQFASVSTHRLTSLPDSRS